MQQAPFLSVIIPVYNTGRYLKDCVDSVLAQNVERMEVILVDDCSQDDSASICQSISLSHDNVRSFVLDRNGGVSAARNTAMQYANGTYVTFVDSDDRLDRHAFATVIQAMEQADMPDIAVYGLREIYLDEEGSVYFERNVTSRAAVCPTRQAVQREVMELERNTLYGYACLKFYRRELLDRHQIRFDTRYKIQEDFLFNADVFDHAQSMCVVEQAMYQYYKRGAANATGAFIPDYYPVHMKRVARLCEQLKAWGEDTTENKAYLAGTFLRYVFSAFERNCDKRAGMTHRERTAFAKDVFSSGLYAELVPYLSAKGIQEKVMAFALKHKSALLCTLLGRCIRIVKRRMPGLFLKAST